MLRIVARGSKLPLPLVCVYLRILSSTFDRLTLASHFLLTTTLLS